MKIIGLLPARLKSSRIKEKLLQKVQGLPIILHTIFRAKIARSINQIIGCTDSHKIKNIVSNYTNTFISKKKHRNGTERIAELANKIDANLIIDIHADEAILDPKNIEKLIKFHKKNNQFDIVVPHKKSRVSGGENVVKIISDKNNKVLYFTRCDAPYGFRKKNNSFFHHLDIISFKPNALRKFSKLKVSNLESIEGVELMRALENNLKIGTFEIKTHTFSVNTPKDLSLVKKLMRKDKYFKKFYEKKKKSSYNF